MHAYIHSIGVVIAVKGSVDESGMFSVSDWTFCNAVTPPPPSTSTSITTTTNTTTTTAPEAVDHHQQHDQQQHHQQHYQHHHTANSTYLLFVSGIEIGNISTATTADDDDSKPPSSSSSSSSSSELSVQLLIDYVAGRLPSQSAIDLDIASKIVR